MSFVDGFGYCFECGDLTGPWSLYEGRWLCDSCIARVKEYEKGHPEVQISDETGNNEAVGGRSEKTME